VVLDSAAAKLRRVRGANPDRDSRKPRLSVGMTGLTPEKRFASHKVRVKGAPLFTRCGLCLQPESYEHLNPMPYEAAAQMEKGLAEDLRRAGYTVAGGY
jgi:hypothetical protein